MHINLLIVTVGASPHKDIVIEPRVSGRWFERGEDGAETNWGRVLAWSSPKSVLLAWQLTASFRYDEKFETEVEVRFEPEGTQQTRITLDHRDLERFGEGADKLTASLDKGWSGFLKMFGEFAEKNAR